MGIHNANYIIDIIRKTYYIVFLMEQPSYTFDFGREVRTEFGRSTQLRRHTAFATLEENAPGASSPRIHRHKSLNQDVTVAILDKMTDSRTRNTSLAFGGHKKAGGVILNPEDGLISHAGGAKDFLRLFTLYHEIAHRIIPGANGATDRSGPVIEGTCDAYAAIRMLQRFGPGIGDVLRQISRFRVREFIQFSNATHLSTLALDRIIADAQLRNFSHFTPHQVIANAVLYARKNAPPCHEVVAAKRELRDATYRITVYAPETLADMEKMAQLAQEARTPLTLHLGLSLAEQSPAVMENYRRGLEENAKRLGQMNLLKRLTPPAPPRSR